MFSRHAHALTFAIWLFFCCQLAHAAGPWWPITDIPRFWVLGEGNSHYSLDTTYFRTDKNYDGSGHPADLFDLDHNDYLSTRLHGAYGFTPRISLFAQLSFNYLNMTNTINSSIPDASNLGFGDGFLGFRWLFHRYNAGRRQDRVYPTEWYPHALFLLLEGSWVFPLYDTARDLTPPLGDQSNDFNTTIRGVWYASEWFAFSGSLGYTYRTAAYAPELPWSIRTDLTFLRNQRLRFWLELLSYETTDKSGPTVNPTHPDPFPNGSLLFKSQEPTIRRVSFGTGYFLSTTWEVSLGALIAASGVNHAKGWGGTLGFSYRPYQVREINYEGYRKEERIRALREPEIIQKQVLRYGFKATILRVSVRGNFFKIGFGTNEGIQIGDSFQVFEPEDFSARERKPIAIAKVVALRPNSAFLRVESLYLPESPEAESIKIIPGYEAQRVELDE